MPYLVCRDGPLDQHLRTTRIVAVGMVTALVVNAGVVGLLGCGVVLFALSRATTDFYPLFVLTLGLFAIHFPPRARWALRMTTAA